MPATVAAVEALDAWIVNRWYSLRATNLCLIFEAFQIRFPTVSLIFIAAKLFHRVIENYKERTISFAFIIIMVVHMKVVVKCLHFVMSCMKQINQNVKKRSRVRRTDWKSSLIDPPRIANMLSAGQHNLNYLL